MTERNLLLSGKDRKKTLFQSANVRNKPTTERLGQKQPYYLAVSPEETLLLSDNVRKNICIEQ